MVTGRRHADHIAAHHSETLSSYNPVFSYNAKATDQGLVAENEIHSSCLW